MPHPASSRFDARRVLAAAALSILLTASGCRSLRDDAVPGCPLCGDPVTVVGPDGLGHVLPRMRIHSDGAAALDQALGFGPWTLVRGDAPRSEDGSPPAAR